MPLPPSVCLLLQRKQHLQLQQQHNSLVQELEVIIAHGAEASQALNRALAEGLKQGQLTGDGIAG